MSINISTPVGFFEWSPAAWLRVAGPDALSFLQGQFSQDLRPLAAAVANAIYDATGVRLRTAPFTPERVKEGMGI